MEGNGIEPIESAFGVRAIIFNLGVSLGLVLISAGVWMAFGIAAALAIAGAVIWTTTIVATWFATPKGGG